MQFNKVMVPVDGSQMSQIAVDIALHSAKTFGSHLTFVYVVDTNPIRNFGTVDINTDMYKARFNGDIVLKTVANKAAKTGADYETLLIEGDIAQSLIDQTREQNMVIMSIVGGNGWRYGGRIGSTARKVIENSFCPVLAVKSGSSKIKDVLLPLSNENMGAIDIAIDTVKRIDGNLTVMCVKGKKVDDAETLVEKVAERCRSAGVNVTTFITEGDASDAIIGESGKYDQIIMGVEKAGVLKQILHGGLTERVVTYASCPVTVVRDL